MKLKKSFSLMLVVALLLSICIVGNVPTYAEDTDLSADNTGICVHHPKHTAECGYVAAVEGTPCTHVHDETCGYAEAVEEIPCDKNCAEINNSTENVTDSTEQSTTETQTAEASTETTGNAETMNEVPSEESIAVASADAEVVHSPDCSYRPAVEAQPCTHVHDETCGYSEGTPGTPCSYAENGCPYCIVSWTWVDEQELFTEVDGKWGMGLPGVSDNNPLTREALEELLPKQINATADNGETVVLDIKWDLSEIPEKGATSGDYTITASLADTAYSLTDDAVALTATIQLGGAETYAELPSGDVPYDKHLVNGLSPSGTTIDLFDYWITTLQTDPDNFQMQYSTTPYGTNHYNMGINKNHAIIFGRGISSVNNTTGTWNHWTGNSDPRKGIVSDKLGVDGYPSLNDLDMNTASWLRGRNGSESLAYLFDPNKFETGKASYKDVKGLLQVDSEGYYYYDSTKNYAVYYDDNKSFALYDRPGVKTGGSSPTGQFFPFNVANNEPNRQNNLMNNLTPTDPSINHYFGMHMSTRFVQQYGGHVDAKREKDVTYEFSGDDDVWIFIDGTLVADLGGIHNAASVSINFANGKISINGTLQEQRLGRILEYDDDTLPDNTYHTLDFFYLERGNWDSNMKLKYNLVTIPESSLIKVDQIGNSVPEAEFTLYAADDTNKSNPIATGTTNSHGEFVFLDENDFPITIDNLYREYGNIGKGEESDLILSETNTPAGYRSIGDVGLYFYQNPTDSNEILLLSNSVWDKGAYAMAKATTTTGNSIMLNNNNEIIKLVGTGAVENPVMFAVVYQKQDNDTWLPVYGDPLEGWHVAKDSSWNSVLEAARANPYVFQLASSGAYQVEISNLPGDIKTYYHFTGKVEDAKYTIAYYYTKAKTIAGANEDNTKLISANRKDGYDLNRVFSVNLYVSNIKNYLLVQKVDDTDDHNPVNGAKFSLYKASDVTVNEDRTVTPTGNAYDTVITGYIDDGSFKLNGGGSFPSQSKGILENGEYYLIETSAPKGYKLNDNAIHVIIDNTGVYADAGNDKDGVTVLRGVGSVMRSMVQFAVEDKVDTTLNDIKAALATDVTYNEDTKSFSYNDADWENEQVLHLKYANENAMLDYGLYNGQGGTIDNLTIPIESGWSKLLIQQCYKHEGQSEDPLKQNLNNTDITDLFSRTVTVRVENERTGNLKISKTVTGDHAPTDKEFTFTVTVTDTDETPITGNYKTDSNDIVFVNGKATFELANDENLTIYGLPTGATYTVEETSVNGYSPSVEVNGDVNAIKDGGKVTGTIVHNTDGGAILVKYTNKFDKNARIALNGTKTLKGREITADDSFTFILTKAEDYGASVEMPETTEVTITGDGKSNTADFRFDPITFTNEGEFAFNITEKLPNGVTKENPVSGGIRYDTHTTVVTVKVTKGDDNILNVVVTSYNNADVSTVTEKAVFENTYESLTLAKTVSGNIGDKNKPFKFEITLSNSDGTPIRDKTFECTGAYATLNTDVNGKATVTLKHGQSITVIGLPTDAKYTIVEKDAEAYTTEITAKPTATIYDDSRTVSGSLSANATTTITYNNERNSGPITGIFLDNLPWILALCFVLFGGSALYLSKKRGINLLNEVKVRIKNGGHNGKNGR